MSACSCSLSSDLLSDGLGARYGLDLIWSHDLPMVTWSGTSRVTTSVRDKEDVLELSDIKDGEEMEEKKDVLVSDWTSELGRSSRSSGTIHIKRACFCWVWYFTTSSSICVCFDMEGIVSVKEITTLEILEL
jgi:hypothetical protein